MDKQIKLIITKQFVAEGFYIMMQGHKPNPAFRSIVTHRLETYEEAFRMAQQLQGAIYLVGRDIKVYNDKWSDEDGNAYCDYMAFEKFELYNEETTD